MKLVSTCGRATGGPVERQRRFIAGRILIPALKVFEGMILCKPRRSFLEKSQTPEPHGGLEGGDARDVPPGRARLSTNPDPSASPTRQKTLPDRSPSCEDHFDTLRSVEREPKGVRRRLEGFFGRHER
jgi:hypothetical protein